VLVEDARTFAKTLRSSSSNPVVYAELPGGQHSFDLFESPRFASVIDGIEAFAAQIRSRQRVDVAVGVGCSLGRTPHGG
jgi:acetyl esterase/lipase